VRHCHAVDDDDVDGIGQRSNDYPRGGLSCGGRP
jgi:hypothetical protein